MKRRQPQKSHAWYVKYPGDAYAMGPLHFDQSVGRMAVRERSKEWSKVNKLPRGFECWPA